MLNPKYPHLTEYLDKKGRESIIFFGDEIQRLRTIYFPVKPALVIQYLDSAGYVPFPFFALMLIRSVSGSVGLTRFN